MPDISLEQALLNLEQIDKDSISQPIGFSSPIDVRQAIQEDHGTVDDMDQGNAEHNNAEDYEFDESDDFNETIDGMGFLTVGPRKSGYTGPQSGIAAVRFLRSLPSERQSDENDPEPGVSPSYSTNSQDFALDSVNIDEMVNDYFTLFHPAYPLLHEGLFRAQMTGKCSLSSLWYYIAKAYRCGT